MKKKQVCGQMQLLMPFESMYLPFTQRFDHFLTMFVVLQYRSRDTLVKRALRRSSVGHSKTVSSMH
jgi:hypothetical protein